MLARGELHVFDRRGALKPKERLALRGATCALDSAKAELAVSGVSGRSKPYVLRGETGPAGMKKMREWHTKIQNAAGPDPT